MMTTNSMALRPVSGGAAGGVDADEEDAVESDVVEVDPDAADPDAADPDAVDPDAVELDAVESDAVELDAVDAVDPEVEGTATPADALMMASTRALLVPARPASRTSQRSETVDSRRSSSRSFIRRRA
jgi:hypothetical protein